MSEVDLSQMRERFASAVRAIWWLTLIRGILLIVLGIYALLNPAMTLLILVQVIGFYLMLDGLIAMWAAVSGQTPARLWVGLRGGLMILVGLFILAHPLIVTAISANVLAYLLAASFIVSGIFEIVTAIQDRKQIEGEGWLILGGAIAILFGLIIFLAPMQAMATIIRVVGIFAIIAGITIVTAAIRLRKFGSNLRK